VRAVVFSFGVRMREPFPPSIVDVKFVSLNSFSKLFDRLVDFPRAAMFFLLLVRCAVEELSMESVCDREFESSDRFFYYLGKMSVCEITKLCNLLLKRAFKLWWRDRRNHRPVFLAIDTSDLAHDGRDTEYVHFTVKKRGLKHSKIKVIRFATISIVLQGFRLTLSVTPVCKKEKLAVIVERLVKEVPKELRVRAVLMDKGFYQSTVLKTLEEHGLKYVVPVKQYEEMTLCYHVAELTGVWRFPYTINKGKPDSYTINVYLEDQGVDSYIGFASNLDMTGRDFFTLIKAYHYRWNIETGYQECNEYRVKTRTRNHGYRVLAYTIGHLLMGIHNLTRKNNKVDVTLDQMRLIFPLLLTPIHGTERITKHLSITY